MERAVVTRFPFPWCVTKGFDDVLGSVLLEELVKQFEHEINLPTCWVRDGQELC